MKSKSSVLLPISNNKSLIKLIMADPRDGDVVTVGIGRRQRENLPVSNVRLPWNLRSDANSCFINVVLVVFANVPSLRQYLETSFPHVVRDNATTSDIAGLWAEVNRRMSSTEISFFPADLIKELQRVTGEPLREQKGDAFMFAMSLFKWADNSVPWRDGDRHSPIRDRDYDQTSPFFSIIGGLYRTRTGNLEPFTSIPLVPTRPRLEDCLRAQLNDYPPRRCSSLPRCLIFSFGRVTFNPATGSSDKNMLFVAYPALLDMRQFCDADVPATSCTLFQLCGVVVHGGPRIDDGHYFAYVKSSDDKQWYSYRESTRVGVSFDTDVSAVQPNLNQAVYMLVYSVLEPGALTSKATQLMNERA